jgi:hypothetical protein
MIVIADSSPLRYLILLDAAHLLQALYVSGGRPGHGCARAIVYRHARPGPRLEQPPAWVDIVEVSSEMVEDDLDLGELVDIPAAPARLKATNFYVDDGLIEAVFQRWLRATYRLPHIQFFVSGAATSGAVRAPPWRFHSVSSHP